MKIRLLLIVTFLCLFTLPSFGQIQIISAEVEKEERFIGEVKSKSFPKRVVASLKEVKWKNGDIFYYLTFRNINYDFKQDYQTITFYGNQETVETLYSVLKDGLQSPHYKAVLKVGEDDFFVNGIMRKETNGVMWSTGLGTSKPLTEYELNLLFGK